MTSTLSDDALRLAAEMRAGLEGVTPGPWSATALTTGIGANQDADGWETVAAIPCPRSPWGSARHRQWQRDAAHIARCDPSNIRLLLDTVDTLRRERDEQHAIVARIWEVLGSPTYEALAGRSIYDLAKEGVTASATIAAQAAEIEGLKESLEYWPETSGSWEQRALAAEATVERLKAEKVPFHADEIAHRILGTLDDFRDLGPEEDENWEDWHRASFDMASEKIQWLLSSGHFVPTLTQSGAGEPVAWRYRVVRWHDGKPSAWKFTDEPELWRFDPKYEVQDLYALSPVEPAQETTR